MYRDVYVICSVQINSLIGTHGGKEIENIFKQSLQTDVQDNITKYKSNKTKLYKLYTNSPEK